MSVREGEREQVRERQREREQKIWSGLRTDSREPDAGLKLTNYEVTTWAKVRCLTGWATQAPKFSHQPHECFSCDSGQHTIFTIFHYNISHLAILMDMRYDNIVVLIYIFLITIKLSAFSYISLTIYISFFLWKLFKYFVCFFTGISNVSISLNINKKRKRTPFDIL